MNAPAEIPDNSVPRANHLTGEKIPEYARQARERYLDLVILESLKQRWEEIPTPEMAQAVAKIGETIIWIHHHLANHE